MALTISGKAMTAAARAAPSQVNGRLMPKVASSQAPSGPWRPKRTSSR